jgi:hypothetical protein
MRRCEKLAWAACLKKMTFHEGGVPPGLLAAFVHGLHFVCLRWQAMCRPHDVHGRLAIFMQHTSLPAVLLSCCCPVVRCLAGHCSVVLLWGVFRPHKTDSPDSWLPTTGSLPVLRRLSGQHCQFVLDL